MNKKPSQDYRPYVIHPYKIFMTLLLAGITMLFLALSAAYMYTRIDMNIPPIRLPNIFFFSTLVLLGTSYTLKLAEKSYLEDNTEKYIKTLFVTILLTGLFMITQAFGWVSLFKGNIGITHSTTASYLYVISALHFAHVLAGLPFLILFLHTARKHMKEPVSVLVYFSDPEKRLKLKLLTRYWHYLDFLWIYLVLFFWINYLIS